MFVEVLKLRRSGEPIASAELQGTQPLRGHIRIGKAPTRRMDPKYDRSATLMRDPMSVEPLLELHRIRPPLVWDPRGLILAGIEETWHRKECTCKQQAWWIRFPSNGSGLVEESLRAMQMQLDELLERLARIGA
jgi:hypothetical protein